MEMVLDPWVLPWDFGKRVQRSSINGFEQGRGHLCESRGGQGMHPAHPHQQFSGTWERHQAPHLTVHSCSDLTPKPSGSVALGTWDPPR